ncbi:TonB-dependent receptor [Sphingobium sp. SCG-1]|uniref:TonB-dependent receptor n=1 Tax=Sphingobium sp. SCG-1 TaxID=2072936 RepID=UPI000CD67956|nr:TonB-dependent receptor [Sphingobium sp. SCG-1]AUW57787.1 TonB-dependent receptor [Sphingobium sp. SCG-1]
MYKTWLMACVAITPGVAFAQSASENGLQDIVVTAQRRPETAQKAAVAINVVSGTSLLDAGITQSDQLGKAVPALTIQRIGPQSAAFIRGVGNFSVTSQSDPAVAFNYDGVYVGRTTATTTSFFDLDRIEVLKGPQGTLYGRNATAGAINILPAQPKFGTNSGYVTASYGNYQALTTEGAVNLALGDDIAIRASGTVIHRDGYLEDGTSDDKSQGARLQLKAALTPSLTARLAFDYSHIGGNGLGLSYLNSFACSAATKSCQVTPVGIPLAQGNHSIASQAYWQSRPVLTVAGRTMDAFPALFRDASFYGYTGTIEYDTGRGVLTVVPAIRIDNDRHLTPSGGFPALSDEKHDQYSVETRFAGKIAPFDYTVGFFYFREKSRALTGANTGGFSASFQSPLNVETKSYAPFLRLTANVSSALRLVGGVRYTHDDKTSDATVTSFTEICVIARCPTAILPPAVLTASQLPFAVPAAGGAPVPGPTPGTIITRSDIAFDQAKTFSKVTWRAAIEYNAAPASLLYASAESGFRSGGFSTSVGYETYDPEYITAYTLGAKNRFFNNILQLNLELFWWNYTNQQVAKPGVDRAGRPGNFTQNIGKSRIRGFELEGRLLITPTTEISGDVQYLDTRFTSFVYQTAKSLGYPRTLCDVSDSVADTTSYDVNCSGMPAYNAPKWTINLAARKSVPVGDYKVAFGVDTQFKTGRFINADFGPEQYQPSFWTTNAQVSFGPSDNRWSVQAFVRNLQNDRTLTAVIGFLGLQSAYISPPRTYGLRGSAKF